MLGAGDRTVACAARINHHHRAARSSHQGAPSGGLFSGLLLGLGTKWDLVRYWWVLAKLRLTLALCVTIVIVLAPGMPEVDRYGAALPTVTAEAVRIVTLFFPPTVSLTALTFDVVLAVVKPWEHIRNKRLLPRSKS